MKEVEITEVELGKVYHIDHRRKGEFDFRFDHVDEDGEFAHGVVVEGGEVFEKLSFRIAFARIFDCEPDPIDPFSDVK